MSSEDGYRKKYLPRLIDDLLWCRRYHLMLIKEIDDKLKKLSKEHNISIAID